MPSTTANQRKMRLFTGFVFPELHHSLCKGGLSFYMEFGIEPAEVVW